DTQAHAAAPAASGSQVAPSGQSPPHVPAASDPHRRAHSVEGPGHPADTPAGSTQRQSCSHLPSTHVSAVHGTPSSQSVSLLHSPPGSVVVVVLVPRHLAEQISFGLAHGTPGPHGSSLHRLLTVTKHRPSASAGRQTHVAA